MRPFLLIIFLGSPWFLPAQIYLDSLPLTPAPASTTAPIAVGYGQQDQRAFNGAATHLEARQFNRGQIYDWNQLWQAQAPGFTVTRTGSDPNEAMDARIRGLRTFSYGQTKPLYVVDGVPGVDPLSVDPADIVSVDVLRDAASTAIYGGRGASGVVLVNTRPTTSGPWRIRYRGQVSVESAARRYTLLDEREFVEQGGTDLSPTTVLNTDWQDLVLQTAASHAHHLSVNKGWAHGSVQGGLHYRDVTGILRESGFEQYNGSLLATQRFWHDRLNLTAGATLGQRVSDYGFSEGYRYAITFNPSGPVRSDDQAYLPFDGYVENYAIDQFNPVALLEQNRHTGRTGFHLLHARAALDLTSRLTASVQLSEQLQDVHDLEYYSRFSKFRGAGVGGSGLTNSRRSQQKSLESTVAYRLGGGDWQGELLGGYGWYYGRVNTTNTQGLGIGDQTPEGKTWDQYRDLLLAFQNPGYPPARSRSDRRLIAFFGRARVQWRDTYFGTFSWRKEGSSNLAPSTRWGVFPGISLGVDVNKWFALPGLDYLKITAGHGKTGSEVTQPGLFQRIYSQGPKFYYNGNFIAGYGITQNPNDHLGWEKTTENSIGVHFSLWAGRLQGAVDGYRYHSRQLIQSLRVSVPPNFGPITIENVGELAGQGTELALNYQLTQNQQLNWEIGLTATHATVTVERYGENADSIQYGYPGFPCGCSVYYQLLYPGATLGTFWGAVATGIDANGTQTYEDLDGNGRVEEYSFDRDQTDLGNAQPKWQLGLRQQLTWRRLDLNLLLQAVTGHHLVSYYRNSYEANGLNSYNRVVTRYYDPALKLRRFNNLLVEDASFLRLQYVAVGYRLPLNRKWLHSLHFQVGAQNLFTLSRYTGLDPDLRLRDRGATDNGGRAASGYGDPLAPGIDRGGYPTARRWWLGVEAEF